MFHRDGVVAVTIEQDVPMEGSACVMRFLDVSHSVLDELGVLVLLCGSQVLSCHNGDRSADITRALSVSLLPNC